MSQEKQIGIIYLSPLQRLTVTLKDNGYVDVSYEDFLVDYFTKEGRWEMNYESGLGMDANQLPGLIETLQAAYKAAGSPTPYETEEAKEARRQLREEMIGGWEEELLATEEERAAFRKKWTRALKEK